MLRLELEKAVKKRLVHIIDTSVRFWSMKGRRVISNKLPLVRAIYWKLHMYW